MANKYILSGAKELVRLESKFNPKTAQNQLFELGFKKGMSFLDVGSGSGAMTRLVAKISPKSNVAGIDIEDDFVLYAKKTAEKQNLRKIKYFESSAYSLPFSDNSFDFVWSRFLFEYLKDPITALKEIRRVVKKGGIVAVGDLDGNCLFNYPMEKGFDKKLHEISRLLEKQGFDPYVGRKLYSYFRKSGFRDIKAEIFPYHNIYGRISNEQLANWKLKLESIMRALGKSGMKKSALGSFSAKFIDYLKNKETYTYCVLIFVKGTK